MGRLSRRKVWRDLAVIGHQGRRRLAGVLLRRDSFYDILRRYWVFDTVFEGRAGMTGGLAHAVLDDLRLGFCFRRAGSIDRGGWVCYFVL